MINNFVVYPPASSVAVPDAILYSLVPLVLFAYCIWRYIRVIRIEFYDHFVRVVGKGGTANIDVPYSDLEVGPLTRTGRSWSHSFKISLKGRSERKEWDVQNAKLRSANTTLYTAVQEHIANVRGAPSVAPIPSAIPGPVPQSRIKQPWLVLLIIGFLMIASSFFLSAALAGGLFIFGLIFILISRTLRARQIRSETSH
ncbi:MAG TPA: hypothetical protein VGS11_10275 [Candidatus Bathyarchaeia archaeon]|nr:hypothetical protein [Candidatus Bathyarchaeia archaeon]